MGYHKLCSQMHDITAETIVEVKDNRMFGGGNLVGSGTNAVNVHVYTSDSRSGGWIPIFGTHTQYSGQCILGKFLAKKYVKVEVSGTGATFDGYWWVG